MIFISEEKISKVLEIILYDFECAYHYLEYVIRHIEYLQKSPDLSDLEKKELLKIYVDISNMMKNLTKLGDVKEVTDLLGNYEEQEN